MERVRAGAVLSLMRRQVIVKPELEYEEIGIRSFGRGVFHKEPVSGAQIGEKRIFRIEPADLVISNVFAWEGAIAVAGNAEAGKVGSHRFMTFVPTDGRIDTTWACWFFRSTRGVDLLGQASPGSAGRNRTLAIARFEALEIPLPCIDEQLRQAQFLDRVALGTDAVFGYFTDHQSATVTSMLPGLLEAAVGKQEVGRSKVGDLADIVSDVVHPGDVVAPAESFVGLQHVESHTGRRLGSDDLTSVKGRKFRFQPGDIIYGYLRPYLNKVWVADRHGLCSVDQYVLRPRADVNAELLAYCLRSRGFLSRAIDLTHNLQLPRLRSGLLSSLEVPVVLADSEPEVVRQLDALRAGVVDIAARRHRQLEIAGALLPSFINEALSFKSADTV